MKAKRCAVTGSTLRELGDTEIDAVGGANRGPNPTWTTTGAIHTTTITSFTLTTTGNEEELQ